MSDVKVGDSAPDVILTVEGERQVRLSDYREKSALVVFFYPKDGSPVCTKEACAFRDAYEDFVDAGAVVIGISGDSAARHQRFANDHRLPFLLAADADGAARRAFGVPGSLGLLPGRVTYVIDKQGIVQHIFNSQFAADRHVREAIQAVNRLNG